VNASRPSGVRFEFTLAGVISLWCMRARLPATYEQVHGLVALLYGATCDREARAVVQLWRVHNFDQRWRAHNIDHDHDASETFFTDMLCDCFKWGAS
jgi:hypothetical protein